MDKSKLKNFILIVLALVNVFLLVIVVNNVSEKRNAEAYRLEALENVLADNGIALDSSIKLPDKIPAPLTLKRNLDKERKWLSALIGNCTAVDKGGNIYYYMGTDGQAKCRGTGEFEMMLNSGVVTEGKDPVEAAKSALSKLKIGYSDLEPIVVKEGSDTTVTLFCSWDGTPIYNSKINFYFKSGSLIIISGSRPLDTKYLVQSSENFPDAVTVLMNFLEYVRQTGDVCSEIKNLEIGYYLSSAVSGDSTLSPIWCIQADSGAFYIDAQTGKSENINISS